MQTKLPEKEILLLTNHLKKRRTLLFTMVSIWTSKLRNKTIGHKLGEFCHEKMGAKITIRSAPKNGKIKKNRNSGSFDNANAYDWVNQTLDASWSQRSK